MRTANKMTNRKYKFIYKITNNINGKIYIGQHITDRLNDGYKGSGIVIEQAFKKYGKHNAKFKKMEKELVKKYANCTIARNLIW